MSLDAHRARSRRARYWSSGRIVAFTLLFIVVAPLASCAYISNERNSALDSVSLGDTREEVIAAFDTTFVAKAAGVGYAKYESLGCKDPCAERLWFENRLSLVDAWSVDFDKGGRAIDKYHWSSP
jgi:hypothetical protein